MLLAGCIFCFMQKWVYAAPVWTGAPDCPAAVLNFKHRKE